jgi:hypothetical protein
MAQGATGFLTKTVLMDNLPEEILAILTKDPAQRP